MDFIIHEGEIQGMLPKVNPEMLMMQIEDCTLMSLLTKTQDNHPEFHQNLLIVIVVNSDCILHEYN